MRNDIPKLLGDPDALAERLSQIEEPHVAPLAAFVRALRERMGPSASIPHFDPWDGGIDAKVLFLLEAPGPKARNSGFVSCNNPDETAKNFFEFLRDAGIDRKQVAVWNIVPWYIGSGQKIRPASSADIERGIESLHELFGLLTKLRCVVLMGNKAQAAEGHIRRINPALMIQRCPHPSPMFVNRHRENRQRLLSKIISVHALLAQAPYRGRADE